MPLPVADRHRGTRLGQRAARPGGAGTPVPRGRVPGSPRPHADRGGVHGSHGEALTVSSLYDDILLEHIRNARNYHVMEGRNQQGSADNPLCGDTFTVYVRMDHGVVGEASFQCECCGISMASASIMTDWVRGKSVDEVLALKKRFLAAVKSRAESLGPDAPPDHEAVLRIVKATPSREGCAVIAWTALETALRNVPDDAAG
ncbi:MAG: SUF system NifU family Fe-S cluster assembly protein [Betaproteobacteria bacterium]|nr:SUF system NifU family Fe-S cluster assembly protein [Betaproteobacteria bacterium]